MQAAISYVLSRLANIADISRDDVQTSLRDGTLRLRNVRLRCDTLNRLLPLPIDSGTVGELEVVIPWPTSSKSVKVTVTGAALRLKMDLEFDEVDRSFEEILRELTEEAILGVRAPEGGVGHDHRQTMAGMTVALSDPLHEAPNPTVSCASETRSPPDESAASEEGQTPRAPGRGGTDSDEVGNDSWAAASSADLEVSDGSESCYESCISSSEFGDARSITSSFSSASSVSDLDDLDGGAGQATGLFATVKAMAVQSFSWLAARPILVQFHNATLILPCDSGNDVNFEIRIDDLGVEIQPTQQVSGSITSLKVTKFAVRGIEVAVQVEAERHKALAVEVLDVTVTRTVRTRTDVELRKNISVSLPQLVSLRADEECLYALTRCVVTRKIMMQLPQHSRGFSALRRGRSWWPFAINCVLAGVRDRHKRYNGNLSYLKFYSAARTQYLALLDTCIRRGDISLSTTALAELEQDLRFRDVIQYLRIYARGRIYPSRRIRDLLSRAGMSHGTAAEAAARDTDPSGSVAASVATPTASPPGDAPGLDAPLVSIHVNVSVLRVLLPASTSLWVRDVALAKRRGEDTFSIGTITLFNGSQVNLLVVDSASLHALSSSGGSLAAAILAAADRGHQHGTAAASAAVASAELGHNITMLQYSMTEKKSCISRAVSLLPFCLTLHSPSILAALRPVVNAIHRIFAQEKLTRTLPQTTAPQQKDTIMSISLPGMVVQLDDVALHMTRVSLTVAKEVTRPVPKVALIAKEIRIAHGENALVEPICVSMSPKDDVVVSPIRLSLSEQFLRQVLALVQQFLAVLAPLEADTKDIQRRYIASPSMSSEEAIRVMRQRATLSVPGVAQHWHLKGTQKLTVEGLSVECKPLSLSVASSAITVTPTSLRGTAVTLGARISMSSLTVRLDWMPGVSLRLDLYKGIRLVAVSLDHSHSTNAASPPTGAPPLPLVVVAEAGPTALYAEFVGESCRREVADFREVQVQACGGAVTGHMNEVSLLGAVKLPHAKAVYISNPGASPTTTAPYNSSFIQAHVVLGHVALATLVNAKVEHLMRFVFDYALPFIDAYVPVRMVQEFNSGLSDMALSISTPTAADEGSPRGAVLSVDEEHSLMLNLALPFHADPSDSPRAQISRAYTAKQQLFPVWPRHLWGSGVSPLIIANNCAMLQLAVELPRLTLTLAHADSPLVVYHLGVEEVTLVMPMSLKPYWTDLPQIASGGAAAVAQNDLDLKVGRLAVFTSFHAPTGATVAWFGTPPGEPQQKVTAAQPSRPLSVTIRGLTYQLTAKSNGTIRRRSSDTHLKWRSLDDVHGCRSTGSSTTGNGAVLAPVPPLALSSASDKTEPSPTSEQGSSLQDASPAVAGKVHAIGVDAVRVSIDGISSQLIEDSAKSLAEVRAALSAITPRVILRAGLYQCRTFDLANGNVFFESVKCDDTLVVVEDCKFLLPLAAAGEAAVVVCRNTFVLFRRCVFVGPVEMEMNVMFIRCEDPSASFLLEECGSVVARDTEVAGVLSSVAQDQLGLGGAPSPQPVPKRLVTIAIGSAAGSLAWHPTGLCLEYSQRKIEVNVLIRQNATSMQLRMERARLDAMVNGFKASLCSRFCFDADSERMHAKRALSLNVNISTDEWRLPVSLVAPLSEAVSQCRSGAAVGHEAAVHGQMYAVPAAQQHSSLSLLKWRVLVNVSPVALHACLPSMVSLLSVSFTNIALWSSKDGETLAAVAELRVGIQSVSVMELSASRWGRLVSRPLQLSVHVEMDDLSCTEYEVNIPSCHMDISNEHILSLNVLAKAMSSWPRDHVALEIVNFCGVPVTILGASGESVCRVERQYVAPRTSGHDGGEETMLLFPLSFRIDGYQSTLTVHPTRNAVPSMHSASSDATLDVDWGTVAAVGSFAGVTKGGLGCASTVALKDGQQLLVTTHFDLTTFTQRVVFNSTNFAVNSTRFDLILVDPHSTSQCGRAGPGATPTNSLVCVVPAQQTVSLPFSLLRVPRLQTHLQEPHAPPNCGKKSESLQLYEMTLLELRHLAEEHGVETLERLETFTFTPPATDDSAEVTPMQSLPPPFQSPSAYLRLSCSLSDRHDVFVLHVAPARQAILNHLSYPVTLFLAEGRGVASDSFADIKSITERFTPSRGSPLDARFSSIAKIASGGDNESSALAYVAHRVEPMQALHLEGYDSEAPLSCIVVMECEDAKYISAEALDLNAVEAGTTEASHVLHHSQHPRRHFVEIHLATTSTSTEPGIFVGCPGVRSSPTLGVAKLHAVLSGNYVSIAAASLFRLVNATGVDVFFNSESGESVGTLAGDALHSVHSVAQCGRNPRRDAAGTARRALFSDGNGDSPNGNLMWSRRAENGSSFAYLPLGQGLSMRSASSLASDVFVVKEGSRDGYMLTCEEPDPTAGTADTESDASIAAAVNEAVLSSPSALSAFYTVAQATQKEVAQYFFIRPIAGRRGSNWMEVVSAVEFVNYSHTHDMVVRHIVREPPSQDPVAESYIIVYADERLPYARLARYGYKDYFAFAMMECSTRVKRDVRPPPRDAPAAGGGSAARVDTAQLPSLGRAMSRSELPKLHESLFFSTEIEAGLSPNTDWAGFISCGATHHAVRVRKQAAWDPAIISVSAPRRPFLTIVNFTSVAFDRVPRLGVRRCTPGSVNERRIQLTPEVAYAATLDPLDVSLEHDGVASEEEERGGALSGHVMATVRVLPTHTIVFLTGAVDGVDSTVSITRVSAAAEDDEAVRAGEVVDRLTSLYLKPFADDAKRPELRVGQHATVPFSAGRYGKQHAVRRPEVVRMDVTMGPTAVQLSRLGQSLVILGFQGAAAWLARSEDHHDTVQFTLTELRVANAVDVDPGDEASPQRNALRLHGFDTTIRDVFITQGLFQAASIQINFGQVHVDLTDRLITHLMRFVADSAIPQALLVAYDTVQWASPPSMEPTQVLDRVDFVTTRFDIECFILAEIGFMVSWERNGTGEDDVLGGSFLSQLVPSLRNASLKFPTTRFNNLECNSSSELLGVVKQAVLVELLRQIPQVVSSVGFLGSSTPFGDIVSRIGSFVFWRKKPVEAGRSSSMLI